MNFVSIIVDAIIKAISYIVSAIVYVGKPVLVTIYTNFISRYLLAPQYAFPNIVNGSIGAGVKSLYYFIMFEIYDPILTLILIALGILVLLNSSIQLGLDFRNLWIKMLLLLVISNISFFLFQDFLYIGSILYSQLWNYGIPSHNFSTGSNILAGLEIGGSSGSIVSLLILAIFTSLMLYLLLFLSLRAAIAYTFPILAPIFTLFLLFPRTKELGERIWFLFLDALVAPILMSIPLILSTYVRKDSVLVLGFLALADALPTMLAFSQSSRALTGFLGRSVSKGVNTSTSFPIKGFRGGQTVVNSLSSVSRSSGIRGAPEIGSVRQFSSLNSGGNADSSLFFKVR